MVQDKGSTGQEVVDTKTGEVTQVKRPFSDNELRNLTSLDSIRALLGDKIGTATDLGSGFAVLSDEQKRRLVGVPCIFLFWNFNTEGKFGTFVSAHVVTLDGAGQVKDKFIINDGSTGIRQQLEEYTERTGESRGMFVPNGLRASDYTYTDPDDGKDKPATTFYIDTAPAV